MKKLFLFLSIATLISCTCLPQIPPQTIYADQNCEGVLPNYLPFITVKDNCQGAIPTQSPLPGTILDAANPWLTVTIEVMDMSGNADRERFDAILMDTVAPELIIDSALLSYTAEQRSSLLRAYHNSIGRDMYKAAQGPDSIWTTSMLKDTAYWMPNPWLDADTMFDTKGMVIRFSPGFGGKSVGSWVEPDMYMLTNLDSTHLKTLGLWPVIEIRIGLPVTIDAAGKTDNWYTQEQGGVTYKYVGAPWNLDEMYKSERYGVFNYKIPTGKGTCVVDLHFCEIYWDDPGKRVFNVNIEGERVLSTFDILAEVNKWTPLVKTFTVEVGFDGFLDIDFPIALVDYAKLSGITIRKTGQMASK